MLMNSAEAAWDNVLCTGRSHPRHLCCGGQAGGKGTPLSDLDTSGLRDTKTVPENYPLPTTAAPISLQKKHWGFSPVSEI